MPRPDPLALAIAIGAGFLGACQDENSPPIAADASGDDAMVEVDAGGDPRVILLAENLRETYDHMNPKLPRHVSFGATGLAPLGDSLYVGLDADAGVRVDGAALARYQAGSDHLVPVQNPQDPVNPICEQGITRLVPAGDLLLIPGIDPSAACGHGWEMGNIYVVEDGRIRLYRNLPEVIHSGGLLVEGRSLWQGSSSVGSGRLYRGRLVISDLTGWTDVVWDDYVVPFEGATGEAQRLGTHLVVQGCNSDAHPEGYHCGFKVSDDEGDSFVWADRFGRSGNGNFRFADTLLAHESLDWDTPYLHLVALRDAPGSPAGLAVERFDVADLGLRGLLATDGARLFASGRDSTVFVTTDLVRWEVHATFPDHDITGMAYWHEERMLVVGGGEREGGSPAALFGVTDEQ